MGTAKRERQKANRQLRLQELAKEQRKEKSKKVAFRVVGGIVLFFVLVGGIYLLGGNDDSSSSSTTSTLPTSTTSGNTTTTIAYPTPEKPTVKFPGADVDALKVTVLKEGTGTGAVAGDTVVVHYIGVLSKDGTAFDNSYDRGQPFPVVLGSNSVIQGWEQGLVGAKKGSQIQLDIPASLAYGDAGQGSIPGGASLTFVIDVMDVIPPAGSTDTTAATQTTAPATTAAATATT
ncbi:MAG: FKBP-type peptidyl-prolyl cis-trans isomerase [Ilumatobacteraceae bacterium]